MRASLLTLFNTAPRPRIPFPYSLPKPFLTSRYARMVHTVPKVSQLKLSYARRLAHIFCCSLTTPLSSSKNATSMANSLTPHPAQPSRFMTPPPASSSEHVLNSIPKIRRKPLPPRRKHSKRSGGQPPESGRQCSGIGSI
jgi:hypothetical protein